MAPGDPRAGLAGDGATSAPGAPADDGAPLPEGLDAAQRALARALRGLARAACDLPGLDPRARADRGQLQAAHAALAAALGASGPVDIELAPGRLRLAEVTLDTDSDPERSLATRLHHEGVRRLCLSPGLDEAEFLALLEALSPSFSRLQPAEDDAAARLRQAGLPHVRVVAEPGPPGPVGPELPPGLADQLPLERPELGAPAPPKWVEPGPERRAGLCAEVPPGEAAAAEVLALFGRLLALLDDPRERATLASLAPLVSELRDQLLCEDHLESLARLVDGLAALTSAPPPEWDPARAATARTLVASLGARRQVRRLLRTMAREQRRPPAAVLAALDRLCADPLAAVASVLPDERNVGVRVAARQILEHYGRARLPEMQQRFLSARGQVASDLLRVMAGLGDDAATTFVVQQSAHPDEAVQDEAVWHLSRMPYSNTVGRALLAAFRQTTRERRARILELIVRTRDRRFVDLLARHVDEHARELTPDEGAGIGRVVGLLGGPSTIDRWRQWLVPRPAGARGFEGPLARQVAALLALAEIPGEEAAEALGEAFDQADDVAQPWVLGALAQRERTGGKSR